MIERYALHTINQLTDRFGLTNGVPKGVKPRFNISPTQAAPVVVRSEGVTSLELMQWGFVPNGAKDVNSVFRYKTFSVKSEKVFSKPAWATAVREKRCIIPANGFYAWWSNGDEVVPYYFSSSDTVVLGLAGIHTTWVDQAGMERQTYALLTVESNDRVPMPLERMPVIIHTDDETQWLDSDVSDFGTLVRIMRPYEGTPLEYHKVGTDVKSKKLDTARLIEPIS